MSTEKKEFGIDNPLAQTDSSSEAPSLDNSLVSNDQHFTNIELFPKTAEEQNEFISIEAIQVPMVEAIQVPMIEMSKVPVVEASEPVEVPESVAAPVVEQPTTHILHNQMDWPIDAGHENAADLLSKPVSEREFHFTDLENELPAIAVQKSNKALNFLLFALVMLVGFGGLFTVGYYSSANREARMKEDAECKVEANTLEQLTKQKAYGSLRIESKPTQATVLQSKDGGKTYQNIKGKTADGMEMDVLTSATVNNIDINETYIYKIELTGYKPETFVVSRYQWILDGATGSYRYPKTVTLTPDACSAWYTFNWKNNKAQEFDSAEKCDAEYQKDSAESTSCRCLAKAFTPPEENKDNAKDNTKAPK